ncbi:hypothetical protein RBXJA2T_13554, partial [Rubrivivax benzoatilyticus JA2 = ATCC BAA-35]
PQRHPGDDAGRAARSRPAGSDNRPRRPSHPCRRTAAGEQRRPRPNPFDRLR